MNILTNLGDDNNNNNGGGDDERTKRTNKSVKMLNELYVSSTFLVFDE